MAFKPKADWRDVPVPGQAEPSLDKFLKNPAELSSLTDEELREVMAEVLTAQEEDRKENQLLYYKPAHHKAEEMHKSTASILGVGGGNRSSKSESVLVELIALATGMIPLCLREELTPKFRGPIHVRVCIESLTTVLHPIMLPKLQWWKWTGIDRPGGERGHWGWVPKICLKDGSWEKSWSEKLRTLTVLCRDPDTPQKILGESIIQWMSYDQDASDFASGTFHHVMHDEPPPRDIWLENRSRVLDVNGRTYIVMTWPKDPAIAVDWIYDEVYEPGLSADPDIDWFEFYTTDNVHLDQKVVAERASKWSKEERDVAIYGKPIAFSNRVHPLFTDVEQTWCFRCVKPVFTLEGHCSECGSNDVIDYCHVIEEEHSRSWPVIQLIDPHPRKPHMLCWVQIDPKDDLFVVQELEVDDEPAVVRERIDQIEESMGLNVVLRIGDPNMLRSPASAKRGITWQQEFEDAGLYFDLADDSDVGRGRLNEYLKPDFSTHAPRFHIHQRCQSAIQQIKRFVWDDFRKALEKGQKQKPKDKNDDFPALFRYCLNTDPQFSYLYRGAPIITRGKREGAYG